MGNFNDNRRGGGGGGRFNGGGGGRFGGGGRDQARPSMHPATCSDCGNRCEVPFRPTGDKPVYCSNCFRKDDESGSNRPDRFDKPRFEKSGKRDFGQRDFGRSNFEERQMHQAECAECGNRCEVPFRPTGDKPVYCSNCFGDNKGKSFDTKKPSQSNDQLEELNKKLDKIIKVLEIISGKKTFIVEKEEVETAKPDVSKAMDAKKDVKKEKKVVAKKKVAKKTTKKAKA